MSYEEEVKEEIQNATSDIPQETDLEQDDLESIIEDYVTVDASWPIYNITASQLGGSSTKPSNIKVEFDIAATFEFLRQTDRFSGEPIEIFAALCSLCAVVSRKMKIDLKPETGFVYWVAYENQEDPWEIPKEELVKLASEQSHSDDVPFELTVDEVENRIQRLCNINSFRIEDEDGKERLILRELCSADWSS